MKSELYRVIYQLAKFCMAVAFALTGYGVYICVSLVQKGVPFFPKTAIAVGASLFGVLLFILATVVMFRFCKRYKEELEMEAQEETKGV